MRDNINVNSSLKLFESYRDFSGGLNTQQSNEEMRDNQSTIAQNVDLALSHSIRKRTGRTKLNGLIGWSETSPVQGLFKFVNNIETILVCAAEGKLWYSRPVGLNYGNWTQIPITDNGSPFTFQTTDVVEAVQYGEWLYVATGTKFVRAKAYNNAGTYTTSAETIVDQYKPTSQEAMYIGLNALNTTPTAFLVDLTTATTVSIEALGIYCPTPKPSINTPVSFTAYRKTNNNAPTDTDTEYEWEYRKSSDTTWTTAVSYGAANANKTYSMTFAEPNQYDIRVKMRLANHHAINDEYIIFGLDVQATPSPTDLPSTAIQRCRRILLHWDRIILYDPKPTTSSGVTNEQDQMYISQVLEPRYFPTSNVVSFAGDTQQHIRKIVRYRNILLVFTPDTVQSLTGKSPSEYVRAVVNPQVGAIWSNSVQVVENEVYFVSKQAIYSIRPNPYIQDNFNIRAIDTLVKDLFEEDFIDSDAVSEQYNATANNQVVSAIYNDQYWLYARNGVIYRYYFERNSWVADTTSHMGTVKFGVPIVGAFNDGQVLIEPVYITGTGTYPSTILYPSASLYPALSSGFLGQNNSVYTDLSLPYTMKLRTKYFDLSQAFNYKKLRRLYIIARMQSYAIHLGVKIEADTSVILDPETGYAETDAITGAVTWVTEITPNFNFYAGTVPFPEVGWEMGVAPLGDIQLSVLRSTIRAKCRRVRLTFQHTEITPCEIYGFGLEFRSKRP